MRLAQRTFNHAAQTRFADVSGDHNPMHVDALQARRTQAGAPVVHGIHLLLWALDSLAAAQPHLPPFHSLRAQFKTFVYLDELVEVEFTQQRDGGFRLSLNVANALRSKVSITCGAALEECPGWSSSLETLPFSPTPHDLDFELWCGRSNRIPFHMTPGDAEELFPAAAKWLGTRRIVAIAATTYLVGMVCPGRHSLYSELAVSACTEPRLEDSLAFRVTEADARFRSVDQEIAGGGLMGTVKSFARHPPTMQARMDSLAEVVTPGEFAGSVVLIVGGSRGLGELTAKLIAAGGGRVIVSWQVGKEDAERVALEIRAAGGMCETLSFDARKPALPQLAALAAAPTHAYYFATPTIFRPQAEMFVQSRLDEFVAIYVDGFWQLAQALRSRRPGVSLFYPSSVFVTERPRGMTEYAMSKAAGEVLCAEMNASLAPLHVTVARLPRLATDQTASFSGQDAALPLDAMLPIVRDVQAWPR